jgi:hypothetical protein
MYVTATDIYKNIPTDLKNVTYSFFPVQLRQ